MDDYSQYYMQSCIFGKGMDVFLNKVTIFGSTKPHAHDFIEIAYVLSGNGMHRIGEIETRCKPGDYFIINYNVLHEFVSDDEKSMEIINCIFRPEFIDYSVLCCKDFDYITTYYLMGSFSPPSGLPLLNMQFHDEDNLNLLLIQMLREYENKKPGFVQIIHAKLVEFLVVTLRSYNIQNINKDVESDKSIYKVIAYIRQHYSANLPLDELAMMAFISPTHFCRKFKNSTGITVTEFTKKIRIEEAANLLVNTNKSIIEIGEQVGYGDIKHFLKVFKQFKGMSPNSYRKDNRI